MVVLRDTLVGGAERAVFWEGRDGAWKYIGFDDFARVGDLWVYVRIMEPLSDATPSGWSSRFEIETRAVLQSILLDNQHAFRTMIGYPAVAPSPFARRRPNER
jgi:hypothetical protein